MEFRNPADLCCDGCFGHDLKRIRKRGRFRLSGMSYKYGAIFGTFPFKIL